VIITFGAGVSGAVRFDRVAPGIPAGLLGVGSPGYQ